MIQRHDLDFDKCAGCPLAGNKFIPADGHSACACFVVGSAPGPGDEENGRAFTGKAGQVVRDIFEGFGLNPFYTNVLKRRVDRRPTREECWRCGLHLIEEMKRAKTEVVLAMGHVPFKFLYGINDLALPQVHGLPMELERFGMEVTVIPTFDVGYVLRNGGVHSKVGDEWLSDIEEFVRVANGR